MVVDIGQFKTKKDFLKVSANITVTTLSERKFIIENGKGLAESWGYRQGMSGSTHTKFEYLTHKTDVNIDMPLIQRYTDLVFRTLYKFFNSDEELNFWMSDQHSVMKQQVKLTNRNGLQFAIKDLLNKYINLSSNEIKLYKIANFDLTSNSSIPFAYLVMGSRQVLMLNDELFDEATTIGILMYTHIENILEKSVKPITKPKHVADIVPKFHRFKKYEYEQEIILWKHFLENEGEFYTPPTDTLPELIDDFNIWVNENSDQLDDIVEEKKLLIW
jgi:hypothetical protein